MDAPEDASVKVAGSGLSGFGFSDAISCYDRKLLTLIGVDPVAVDLRDQYDIAMSKRSIVPPRVANA